MFDLDDFRGTNLTAPDFWARALGAVEALDDDDVCRGSQSRDVQALLEEVLPLAFLVRDLDIPERRAYCRYFGRDSAPYDAHLQFSGRHVERGLLKPLYHVEVTSAQFPKEYLRREALELHGGVFFDPDICAKGKRGSDDRQVVSRPVLRDKEDPILDAERWVREAVTNKLDRSYSKPSILLVRVAPDRNLALSEWVQVANVVPKRKDRNVFDWVFLVNPNTGFVLCAD